MMNMTSRMVPASTALAANNRSHWQSDRASTGRDRLSGGLYIQCRIWAESVELLARNPADFADRVNDQDVNEGTQ